MRSVFLSIVVGVCIRTVFSDILVADCENGTERNNLGWQWYYFSDAPDSGNSIIHGAEHFGGGRYSAVVCDSPGYNSNYCAKIAFTFGAKMKKIGYNLYPFVGMGMDVARPGTVVDLLGMDSISFWARGSQDLTVYFEFVSKDIDSGSWAYWGYPVEVNPEWTRYSISLMDFWQPGWANDNMFRTVDQSFPAVQKLNWQARKEENPAIDSGYVEIDDVYLNGFSRGFPPIRLLSPKAGDVFSRGDTVAVTWAGIGNTYLSIAISYDNSAHFTTYCASTPNDGQEKIRITANATISDFCILRLSPLDEKIKSMTSESGRFRIIEPTPSGVIKEPKLESIPPRVTGSNVKFRLAHASSVNITLQTIDGRIIFHSRFPSCPPGEHCVTFPIQKLRSGCYVAHTAIGGKIFSQMFFACD